MLYCLLRLGSPDDNLLFRPSLPARAAAFATVAVIFTGPAFAQQAQVTPVATNAEEVTVNTDCKTYQPGVVMADTKCEILKGRALDAQAKLLADEKTCLLKLIEFKKAFRQKFDQLGPVSRANACEAASRIPKPAASASPRVGS